MAGKILTVSTSADLLNGLKTGLWLEELAAPYYVWKENGFDVVIGAVSDNIPLDVASLAEDMKGPLTNKFLEDSTALCTKPCSCIEIVDYLSKISPQGQRLQ
jgi:putative intracellular protease/amidase